MNLDTTRKAVLAAFEAGWTGAAATAVPVQRPNQKFKQPTTGPWGRLTLNFGSRASVAVGGARIRQTALAELQLFAPEDSGTAVIYRAADLFASFMDTLQLTPADGLLVEFEHVGMIQGGTVNGYEQIIASIPFRVDKTT